MEIFRQIHADLNKAERSYESLINFLFSEANYHAAILNDYQIGSPDILSDKFKAHAIAYLTLSKIIDLQSKHTLLPQSFSRTLCKHDLEFLVNELNK